MKICVLQPDYSTSNVDYQDYDPPRNLSRWLKGHEVEHVFINKLTTYKQIKTLSRQNFDIYINLCEGYLEWEVPSIDVIYTLENLNLPFTGPSSKLYDPTKPLMKYVAHCAGVNTPDYEVINTMSDLARVTDRMTFPLFVKPAKAGDSLGVDENSKVKDAAELSMKVGQLLPEYGEVLVEKYIGGREFTVLVAANAEPDGTCTAFLPVEYKFPAGRWFKTYALKTSELHPDCNIPCQDLSLDKTLRSAAKRIFQAFGGVGYARMDFRVDEDNRVFFLEVNFTCSVFYTDGYEGSADFILLHDGVGHKGFLKHIISEGLARHHKKQKKYVLKGNAVSGFGIYARERINKGEIIFNNETQPHRIVTRPFVDKHWKGEEEQDNFRRYAYPLSSEVYALWDEDPEAWAPENHSCDANTSYDGLNVVAIRAIKKDEELTLDYSSFLDERSEPFMCACGSSKCRGLIMGTPGNSVTHKILEVRKIAVDD